MLSAQNLQTPIHFESNTNKNVKSDKVITSVKANRESFNTRKVPSHLLSYDLHKNKLYPFQYSK